MVKEQSMLLWFALLFLVFSEASSHLSEVSGPSDPPHESRSFKLNHTQNSGSCSYTVSVTTSCSSPVYTRDEISLAFGDAYGNQVYVPRIDDPASRTFERCSTDEFEIYGPCTYQVCYMYFYRSGYDGWLPETVTIYGYYTRSITFYYDTFVPYGVWFGFDYCGGSSTSTKSSSALAM
ncbi:hypothetical protein MLD38_005605 [Melastoma candidum]|uniref:Uncharacterized protein n=1 Tax=Melastoma candidum TaxID=119954 RepID=A0ACB9RJS8_9MYRT|nr:hypothetical protein MLD38_005605 [Melastoma candidum]